MEQKHILLTSVAIIVMFIVIILIVYYRKKDDGDDVTKLSSSAKRDEQRLAAKPIHMQQLVRSSTPIENQQPKGGVIPLINAINNKQTQASKRSVESYSPTNEVGQ